MGSVGAPILGRPRPLPGHRRADPSALQPSAVYTLNWEEPLKLHRSVESQRVDLGATLAHTFVLQVGEGPESLVPLVDVMEAVNDSVLAVVLRFTGALDEEVLSPEILELGLDHAAVAPEFGGLSLRWE